ncbi:MAG TPA: transcriptional repressor LexA, partial [Burkholderiaceae bacterium]|nr:transcriptional repressor LexA [Burkholderiaceae bacterium]
MRANRDGNQTYPQKPTPRQEEILDFIRNTMAEKGAPPTRSEIAKAFKFNSVNAAEQHLKALDKKGLIKLVSGTSRGIRLADAIRAMGSAACDFGLPLVGKVAAGSPVLAQENIVKRPAVDPAAFKPRADYLLEVRGMSMRDAGIFDGDWIAVHKQKEARNGQIVVARIGSDVAVKRFRTKGLQVELVSENPEFAPIVVDPKSEDFAI